MAVFEGFEAMKQLRQLAAAELLVSANNSSVAYHVRSRIEAQMRCLKAFGERISSRDPDRQAAEIHVRIALMNCFNALGTAMIKRVA